MGRFSRLCVLLITLGRLGYNTFASDPRIPFVSSGENTYRQPGSQKSQGTTLVFMYSQSMPKRIRCLPFCQLSVSLSSPERACRNCGEFTLAPVPYVLDPIIDTIAGSPKPMHG